MKTLRFSLGSALVSFLLAAGNADALTPALPDLTGIVKDRNWALVLGKALFWDQQAGSDGQACASCHFSAGADPRIDNVLTPGSLRLPIASIAFGGLPDFDGEAIPNFLSYDRTRSGSYPIDAAYQLKPEDFPLYSLTDYRNRNSAIEIATDDGVSSPGSFASRFLGIQPPPLANDKCGEFCADVFRAGRLPARQVEPRNTPTTINAVFNLFNFWDGRANRRFNGVGVFGPRDIAGDPQKRLILLDALGNPALGYLQLDNASLASQAVGPPLSGKEMSCEGRRFLHVGRKLLVRRALAGQKVHPNDSLFGAAGPFGDLRNSSGDGLKLEYVYADLIRRAFDDAFWKHGGRFVITADGQLKPQSSGYLQIEHNFSMFWGIAIMLYESTLVSDQSRFDTWLARCNPAITNPGDPLAVPIADPVVTCRNAPSDPTAPAHGGLTTQEVLGFGLFNNGGVGIRNPGNNACNGCHNIPLFSEAQLQAGQNFVPVERSRIDLVSPPDEIAANCAAGPPPRCGGVHDRGFFNIGTRPTSFDPGAGGVDPYGNPLSAARMFLLEQSGAPAVDPTGIVNRCNTATLLEGGGTPPFPGCPTAPPALPPPLDAAAELELVDGTFKTPSLRNVALTPPYFHFGGYATLRDVVRFYARGGSRRDKSLIDASYTGDTSGSGPLGKEIVPAEPPNFGTNVDFFIRDVRTTDAQIDALVAFMMTLTDRRVQCDQAPFDHPSLLVFRKQLRADRNRDARADDEIFELPEVGAAGYDAASGFCIPNAGNLFAPGMQSRSGGLRVPLAE